MSNEATKTRAIWGPDVMNLLRGQGIDIGCGPDPVLPNVDRFDFEQGDANTITRYVQKQYDFVFSSHTLEHMVDPYAALGEWFALVKPGGHLIVLVPDEDLYEQGHFPSIFRDRDRAACRSACDRRRCARCRTSACPEACAEPPRRSNSPRSDRIRYRRRSP